MGVLKLAGSPRPYEVLNPAAYINLAGSTRRVEEIAREYKPVVRQDPTLGKPPICIKYEAIDDPRRLKIRYHVVWSDETHPVHLVDRVYSHFRTLYYGSTMDSEKIEISVSKSTGEVSGALFETEPRPGRAMLPRHAIAILHKEDGKYLLSIEGGRPREIIPNLLDKRIEFETETWNHEFSLATGRRSSLIGHDLPIIFLEESEYTALRYSVRCAATDGPRRSSIMRKILIAIWFMFAAFVLILTARRPSEP